MSCLCYGNILVSYTRGVLLNIFVTEFSEIFRKNSNENVVGWLFCIAIVEEQFPISMAYMYRGKSIITGWARLISLHTRSVWETICDALHIPVARIFGSELLESPSSSKHLRNVGLNPSPLPQNEDFDRSWHFGLSWSGPPPPPPPKCRFGQILAFWDYVGTRVWTLIPVSPKDTVSFSQ